MKLNSLKCKICIKGYLKEFKDFNLLSRVTSDSKPFKHGGFFPALRRTAKMALKKLSLRRSPKPGLSPMLGWAQWCMHLKLLPALWARSGAGEPCHG